MIEDKRVGIKQVTLPEDSQRVQLKMGAELVARLEAEGKRVLPNVSKSEVVRVACEFFLSMPAELRDRELAQDS